MTANVVAIPPSVSWAQSSARVYLTFNVECEKPDINIENKCISFKGHCAPDHKLHAVDIPLYAEINAEKSSFVNKGRYIEVVLAKEKVQEAFWPALTSDMKKHHWLKVDFNRWQDEEDSGEELDDINDMFSSKLGDFGDEKGDTSSTEEDDLLDIE
ncbi:hypothetical protein JYU34_011362 [Plutella xylostella]|nr:hypothetical protein JYU34_011362 [Plutella xylostella]